MGCDKIVCLRENKIKGSVVSFLIFNLFLLYAMIKSFSYSGLTIIIGVDLIFLLYFILDMTVVEVEVVKDKLILKYENIVHNKKIKSFDLSTIEYTYKIEAISRFGKENVLRIFCNKKMIVKLYDDYEGWTAELADQLVLLLDANGVKRHFTGFALKDVYPMK